MTTPMFNRTGSDDFPIHLKAMLTGPPKSGKTSFLGTVPGIVIADTEPHANNLASVAHLDLPYVTVRGTDDLMRLRLVLGDDTLRAQAAEQLNMPDGIKAVAIDTLDTLQAIMKRERLRTERKSQFLRDDWGWLKEEMTSMLEAFLSLPMHVFFIVHVKTKELGSGDDARTIVLPGLEGSIAESIAGMVGYSLLAFRKQEIRPDGSPYTKYWLRAEGDETYDYLGNRAAGRLPDIIEPDFKTLLGAAMAGRPTQQAPAVQMPTIQTTGQIANNINSTVSAVVDQTPPPAAPNTSTAQPAPQQPQEAAPSQGQPQAPVTPPLAPDDTPMNAAALGHIKKVYDAVFGPSAAFPEDTIKGITLGDGRNIVKMWKAVQIDYAEGKGTEGSTPEADMAKYLEDMGWAPTAQAATPPAAVEPKVDGTIEQVLAYAGDDLAKVQEAYNLEVSKDADKQRSSLVTALEKKGATVQTPVENQQAGDTAAPVTPQAPAADASPEETAVATVQQSLGGEVISDTGAPEKCAECGKPIDDDDIANLSEQRYGKRLCVEDYLAEGKK